MMCFIFLSSCLLKLVRMMLLHHLGGQLAIFCTYGVVEIIAGVAPTTFSAPRWTFPYFIFITSFITIVLYYWELHWTGNRRTSKQTYPRWERRRDGPCELHPSTFSISKFACCASLISNRYHEITYSQFRTPRQPMTLHEHCTRPKLITASYRSKIEELPKSWELRPFSCSPFQ